MVTAATLQIGASHLASPSNPLPDAPAFPLHLALSTTNDLPAAARASLVSEADSIWRREGVRLQWTEDAEPLSSPTARLKVIVLGAKTIRGDEVWALAELITDASGRALVMTSTSAATRVVKSAGHRDEPSHAADRRLGMVLGRAIAHEIGHYLLGTRDHARRGLMRAFIDAREFADLRGGRFFLDAAASRWIRQLPSRGDMPLSDWTPFTYGH
jgi:hypothetical protein